VGVYLVVLAGVVRRKRPNPSTHKAATALITLVIVQLLAGFVNLALLAPIWHQMAHLVLADLVWISLIVLAASALASVSPHRAASREPHVGSHP